MQNKDYFSKDRTPTRGFNRVVIRKLFSYILRYKALGILSLFIVIAGTILFLMGPYLFGYTIDHGIVNGDISLLYKMAIALFGIKTVRLLLIVIQSYNLQMIGQKVTMDMRMELFRHIHSLPVSFFDKNPVGRIVTRLTNDIASISELFSVGVITVIGDLFIIAGIIVAMFLLDVQLGLLSLLAFPIMIILACWFGARMKNSFREIRRKLAQINSYLNENITGMKVIQLFNREGKNYKIFGEISDDNLKEQSKYITYFAIFQPSIHMVSGFTIAIILWYGGMRYLDGVLTLGVLVTFLTYVQNLFDPIRDIIEKYNIFQGAMASSERVFGLMEEQQEPDYSIANPYREIPKREFKGDIIFRNVWFAYNDSDFVLKNISFQVKHGQSVALVGVTGSGKTSIANVLTRFYEIQKGAIFIDGIDIKKIEKIGLRYMIGYISQDVFLFSGTLRENITLFRHMEDSELLSIINSLGLMPFINRMQDGLDTKISERGANLSVGERQFISLSRIILYDPQIIILDEATSSMDPLSEVFIQEAMHKITKGKTSILIAHRLSTILHCDKIIELNRGEIIEEGTHEELLKKDSLYRQLYQLSLKGKFVESRLM
ncbi:putative ATP-binding transport protein [Candidatus Kuenenia stuttgartiensis]|uniref:Putative ATP-binding transport protein n=1 Tax=Kuenenia stuttgartiensis TaxID=174633 RepID=A0A6G7GX25_KUEST|nr:ABC transporter ATP-binding protein [Candidatus Kuenenia stuttgartiensis]QII13902.1 putative ATP-binding transport protein [Candidatus Kuenenia stuttgartiensis]